MAPIPEIINVKIVDADTFEPVSNIVIVVRLFAKHKNDYYCLPHKSNEDGEIIIAAEWLNKEIEKARNLFVMDFSSTLDDCKPKMEFVIMDIDSIKIKVENMKEWKNLYKIADEEIDNLLNVNNGRYKPMSQIVNFHGETIKNIELRIKKIKVITC